MTAAQHVIKLIFSPASVPVLKLEVGADMASKAEISSMAQCETCGQAYDGKLERCQRCRSNQRNLKSLDVACAYRRQAERGRVRTQELRTLR